MSQALTLARPYARAAYDTARSASATAEWSRALAVSAALAGDGRVGQLLGNPGLNRTALVNLVAPDNARPDVRNFLELLAVNNRLTVLPEIADLFEQARADDQKIVRAKITSAAPMTQAELDALKTALNRRFGRDVEVETALDEGLIGGAVIDAGDVVIDGSLKGKLERLRTTLTQ